MRGFPKRRNFYLPAVFAYWSSDFGRKFLIGGEKKGCLFLLPAVFVYLVNVFESKFMIGGEKKGGLLACCPQFAYWSMFLKGIL